MLDHRMYTFMELCKTMNYGRAARNLNITQPAVSQHIKYLEDAYDCKLFDYNKKVLSKTGECVKLEAYVRAEIYNHEALRQRLAVKGQPPMNLGVTKTIGDYVMPDVLAELSLNTDYRLSVTVDNTKQLLDLLNDGGLDIAIIEGIFDKQSYGYQLYRKESFHGFCSADSDLAGQTVALRDLFARRLILREEGSGTRKILEQFLRSVNHSVDDFHQSISFNSFRLIEYFVGGDHGITFAYNAFAAGNKDISPFYIEDQPIVREFNIVYLKNASIDAMFQVLTDAIQKNQQAHKEQC